MFVNKINLKCFLFSGLPVINGLFSTLKVFQNVTVFCSLLVLIV